MNQHQNTFTTALLLVAAFLVVATLPAAQAFAPIQQQSLPTHACTSTGNAPPRPSSTSLLMAQMGPVARAKKMMDPKEYNRIVEQKMAQEGLTRQQAEAEYNQFLENPPFYYALDKKADCKSSRALSVDVV